MLVTTIGYERRLNEMLLNLDNEDLELQCLDLGPLPTVPPYWRRMRQQNQDGPARLGALAEPQTLQAQAFVHRITAGAIVVDCL